MLFGVLCHHLIQPRRVKRAGLWIVQRRARQPHVRAKMRIGFGSARVVKPAQEAELFAEGSQRLRRLSKDKLAGRLLGGRKPVPLFETMFGSRQRHAVGRVNRAETARHLRRRLRTHHVQNRQSERRSTQTIQKRAPVNLKRGTHLCVLV